MNTCSLYMNPNKIIIDKSKCLRCGFCTNIYPEAFKFERNGIKILFDKINIRDSKLTSVIDSCPGKAIRFHKRTDA